MNGFLRWRLVLLHILAAAALIAATLPPLAGAQSSTGSLADGMTYGTVTGQALAWGDPWAFDESRSERAEAHDIVFLTSGSATLVIATGDWTVPDSRTAAYTAIGGDSAAVTTLDEGETYWFQLVPIDGVTSGVFGLASTAPEGVSTVITMIVAPVPGFASGLGSAQAGVTLDGTPVLNGVDGVTLQGQLEAQVPEVPVAEATTPAFEPIDSWTDEAFGYTVEWADGWSSLGTRNDNTFMLGPDDETVSVNMTAIPRQGSTPQDWANEMGPRLQEIEADVEVLDPVVGGNNTIVVGLFKDMAIVEEVLFLDDGQTVVVVTLGVGDPEDMVPVAESYRTSVRIDGRAPLEGWEGIAAQLPEPAAASAPAPTTVPTAVEEVEYADAGMVTETSYVSPQFGTSVQWTEEWALSPASPVETDPGNSIDSLSLTWTGSRQNLLLVFSIPSYGVTIDQFVAYASSAERTAADFPMEATVVLADATSTRGGLLIHVPEMANTFIYEEFRLSDDGSTITIVRLAGILGPDGNVERDLKPTLTAAQEGVTVNGEPVLTYFTVDVVVQAFSQ